MESKTFVAIQYGGYYGERCVANGYMKQGDAAVIEYKQFMKFMNENVVTRPVFVTPYYSVAVEVARDLNNSANEIELQRQLKEWVNSRA